MTLISKARQLRSGGDLAASSNQLARSLNTQQQGVSMGRNAEPTAKFPQQHEAVCPYSVRERLQRGRFHRRANEEIARTLRRRRTALVLQMPGLEELQPPQCLNEAGQDYILCSGDASDRSARIQRQKSGSSAASAKRMPLRTNSAGRSAGAMSVETNPTSPVEGVDQTQPCARTHSASRG
jgi:hypothetical protein